MAHSGGDDFYYNFINAIKDESFLKKVRDIYGRNRKNDSELKFIYNFLSKHMDEGNGISIKMYNIFKPCYSCKREFLMFKEFLENSGKKVDFEMFYDETIKGSKELQDILN